MSRIDRIPFRRRDPADYEVMYAGQPPWEINRPEPAYRDLAEAGRLRGRVLDVGCGSGEHAMLAASLGHEALGIDFAPTAIERAQAKAADRGLDVRFRCHDVLALSEMGERFDTLLDAGMFHTLDDDQRPAYAASTASAALPGAHLFVLCFSDDQPGTLGPRRVAPDELVAALLSHWEKVEVTRTRLDSTAGEGEVAGLLGEFVLR